MQDKKTFCFGNRPGFIEIKQTGDTKRRHRKNNGDRKNRRSG